MRPMRQISRVMRPTRLAPVQRLARMVGDLRRWLAGVLKPGQPTEAIAQKIEQNGPVEQPEKITPILKQTAERKLRRTLREQMRQKVQQNRQQQGRSRGIRM